jgi:hypothetical protein
MERGRLVGGGHGIDSRARWPGLEEAGELLDRPKGTDRQYLDAAIGEIPCDTAQAETLGHPGRAGTEKHALDPTTDAKAAGRDVPRAHAGSRLRHSRDDRDGRLMVRSRLHG